MSNTEDNHTKIQPLQEGTSKPSIWPAANELLIALMRLYLLDRPNGKTDNEQSLY